MSPAGECASAVFKRQLLETTAINYAPGTFDDMTRWILRPRMFAAMVQAGKLP